MEWFDSNKKTRKNLTNDFYQHIMKQRINKPMIKSSKLILLFREPPVGCEGDRAWQCEWTYEGKAKGFNQVVFDGISARYQGNIHNCMDKVGRNTNMGGTAGVTLLSLF